MNDVLQIAPLLWDVGVLGGLFVLFFYVVARSPIAFRLSGRFCLKVGQYELDTDPTRTEPNRTDQNGHQSA